VLFVLAFILSACFPGTPTPVLTTSSEYIKAAWDAYNANKFPEAASLAQECISKWETKAKEQQSALTQAPLNGQVTEDQKKAIQANWALNDVGTAYFIKAQALEKQGKTDEAKKVYEQTAAFPYARAWDPKGWFWSPADEAGAKSAQMP